MTSCNRSNSPILKRLEGQGRRERELITDEAKIHRIVLSGSSALCTLAHIQSPNCIWFKLCNHITDKLQIHLTEPLSALELIKSPEVIDKKTNKFKEASSNDHGGVASSSSPSSEIQLYQYVMAPLEENVYARGRITKLPGEIVNSRNGRIYQFSYVHFIDEGYGAWMNTECLAKMDPQLYWHPWQAFSISLFKFCYLQNFPRKNGQSIWPNGLTERLECIMTEYDTFRVDPVWESRRFCDRTYWDYVRANVYGVVSECSEKSAGENGNCNEESIAHRLALEFAHQNLEFKPSVRNSCGSTGCNPSAFFARTLFDAKQQSLLCEPIEELTDDLLSGGIPRWRLLKPKFT